MSKLTVDFRFLEIKIELDSLKDLLETIKQQESKLSEIRLDEINKYLFSLKSEDVESEWDVLRQTYYYQTEHLYPKSFRGSFLVSLWATTESSLQEFANYIQKKKEIKLYLSDIRGDDIINRLEKYFSRVLDFEFFSKPILKQLSSVYIIRNCFAHANGRIDVLKDNEKQKIHRLNENNTVYKEDQGYLILELEYLESTYNLINQELQQLMIKIKEWDN